jgi:hypothetical protein
MSQIKQNGPQSTRHGAQIWKRFNLAGPTIATILKTGTNFATTASVCMKGEQHGIQRLPRTAYGGGDCAVCHSSRRWLGEAPGSPQSGFKGTELVPFPDASDQTLSTPTNRASDSASYKQYEAQRFPASGFRFTLVLNGWAAPRR